MKNIKIPLILSFFYAVSFSFISAYMYQNLLYKDQDLALFSNILWNISNGSGFSAILGSHFLANHVCVFFFILKYFFLVLPSPLLLLTLQSIALGSGIILSFLVATHYLKPKWSLVVGLSYLFYPATILTNLYEFHPTTLAIPFFLVMILGYLDKKTFLFWIGALGAMSLQENLSFAVFMMGVVGLIEKKQWPWVWLPMALSMTWFGLCVFKIQPHFNQGNIEWHLVYAHLGNGWREILTTFLTKPWVVFNFLISKETFIYWNRLFSPLLLVPLAGWQYVLVALPFFFQHALSSREVERLYSFHYFVEIIPFLIWALASGLNKLLKKFNARQRRLLLYGFIFSFLYSTINNFIFIGRQHLLDKNFLNSDLEQKLKMIDQIPPDASVVATTAFLPKLSLRAKLYAFHHIYLGAHTLSSQAYSAPKDIQYALIDMRDPYTFEYQERKEEYQNNLERFLTQNNWKLVSSSSSTVLLKKNG